MGKRADKLKLEEKKIWEETKMKRAHQEVFLDTEDGAQGEIL